MSRELPASLLAANVVTWFGLRETQTAHKHFIRKTAQS